MWRCGAPVVRYMIFRGKPEAWCEFHSSKTNLEEVMVNGDREISEQEYHRVCVVLSIHDS